MSLSLGESGPEDWQNKPPESYPVVQPPSRPHAGSATSDGASEYIPNDSGSPSPSELLSTPSEIPVRPPASTPIKKGRSASLSAQPSVGKTGDSLGEVVIRKKGGGQVLWDECRVGDQLLDDWLIEQVNQEQQWQSMSDRLDGRIGPPALRNRCKHLGKKPTKT